MTIYLIVMSEVGQPGQFVSRVATSGILLLSVLLTVLHRVFIDQVLLKTAVFVGEILATPLSRPFVPPSDQSLNRQGLFQHAESSTHRVHAPMSNASLPISAGVVLEATHRPDVAALSFVLANNEFVEFNPLPTAVCSPINVSVLGYYLQGHPNISFVSFLLHGFTRGFSIGYTGPPSPLVCRNLASARSNLLAVVQAISKEIRRGHTSGPFLNAPLLEMHCSPLGAVPKKDGSFRIILDLSSPRGASINEHISASEFSVKYSLFDDAVDMVKTFEQQCFMCKVDIKHAFRLCPVQPSDWKHLAFSWNNLFFVDTRLPFGSRSSPFIFNQFAEALLWILSTVIGVKFLIH